MSLARVAPLVQRRSLNHHIARLERARLVVRHRKLDFTHKQNDYVEAHGTVHGAFGAGGNVVVPDVGTAAWRDEGDSSLQGGFVA